jgi:hypothetical protein
VVGILSMAAGSIVSFQFDITGALSVWGALYYSISMITASLFSIAALMILEWRRAILPVIAVLGISLAFVISIPLLELNLNYGAVAGPPTLVLYMIPFALFAFLAQKTGRITAIALGFLIITYITFPISTVLTDQSMIAALLGIRLLGPALATWAFLRPELGVSIELFGYALSINIVAFFFSYMVAFGIGDVALAISLTLVSLLSVIGFATATYTFTRYRERRNPATGLLAGYFVFGSVSFIIVALTALGALTGYLNPYTSAILGLLAMVFVNLSAFVALDWKRVLLLPVVIAAPVFVYILLNLPSGQPLDALSLYGPIYGITNLIQILVPIGLYFLLWHRMGAADAAGRSRPLFIGLGLILQVIGSLVGIITEGEFTSVGIVPSLVLFISYLVFWLGVTGRADKLFGTV